MNDAFFPRHPVNADVQETAHDASEGKEARCPKLRRNLGQDFGIEDGIHPLRFFSSAARITATGAGRPVHNSNARVP